MSPDENSGLPDSKDSALSHTLTCLQGHIQRKSILNIKEKNVRNNVISIIDVVSEGAKGPHSNLRVSHLHEILSKTSSSMSFSQLLACSADVPNSYFSFPIFPKLSPNLVCVADSGLSYS